MSRHILFSLALAFSVCGCLSGQAGNSPTPVWKPTIDEVRTPAGMLASGEMAGFTVIWRNGRAPFAVEWDFGGGGEPDMASATTSERIHSASVTVLNEGAAPVAFTGMVAIEDADGSQVAQGFSFTVQPSG